MNREFHPHIVWFKQPEIPHLMRFPYVGVCDGHALGLDGGLPGHAAAPLLQRHLPVGQSQLVGSGAPGGPRSVAVGRGRSAGRNVHGCHQVGQLVVVFELCLRPACGVGAHVGHLQQVPSVQEVPGEQQHHGTERTQVDGETHWNVGIQLVTLLHHIFGNGSFILVRLIVLSLYFLCFYFNQRHSSTLTAHNAQ